MSRPRPTPAERSHVAALRELLRVDGAFWREALGRGVEVVPAPVLRALPYLLGPAFGLASARAWSAASRVVARSGRDPSPARVARVFVRYAQSLGEAFFLASRGTERFRARVVGGEHFEQARRVGRGVILLTAHTSGWYTAGLTLRDRCDDELALVMRRERDEGAEAVQAEMRRRLGLRAIHVGGHPLDGIEVLAHLRRRGLAALQLDRVPNGQVGRTVSISGQPFAIAEGPFLLAAASGAPIVVVLGRRTGYLEYEVEMSAPLEVPRRPSKDDLERLAREVGHVLERFVVRFYEDWFHFVS